LACFITSSDHVSQANVHRRLAERGNILANPLIAKAYCGPVSSREALPAEDFQDRRKMSLDSSSIGKSMRGSIRGPAPRIYPRLGRRPSRHLASNPRLSSLPSRPRHLPTRAPRLSTRDPQTATFAPSTAPLAPRLSLLPPQNAAARGKRLCLTVESVLLSSPTARHAA